MGFIPSGHPKLPIDTFTDKFPKGSDEAKGAELMIDLIKQAHQIMKALIQGRKEDEAVIIGQIEGFFRTKGITDQIVLNALVSLIITAATSIPPTAYGEDFTDWVPDDRN